MFNSISWQDFLFTIGVIVGGYYVITTLLLYSNEIKSIFNQGVSKSIEHDVSDDQNDSDESNDLMGGVKYETQVNVPHEKIVEYDELTVQRNNEAEDPIEQFDPNEGFAKTLTTEIETLITEVSSSDEAEIILVFKSLLSVYPQLVNTPRKNSINLLIYNSLREKSVFHPELNEINSWWTQATVN